jgi:hypothetical protein
VRVFAAFGVLTLLVACDNGPIKRSLAECKLSADTKANQSSSNNYVNYYSYLHYLSLCMEAKGFVVENHRITSGVECWRVDDEEAIADCYRPDNWLAKWWFASSSRNSK